MIDNDPLIILARISILGEKRYEKVVQGDHSGCAKPPVDIDLKV